MQKLNSNVTDKFKDDYLKGMTVTDIGKKYGCNQVTVSKYLKKQGVSIVPVPPKSRKTKKLYPLHLTLQPFYNKLLLS